VLHAILAEGMVAHVGLIRDGLPVVLPLLYGIGDISDGHGTQMFLHGSTGAGIFLAARGPGIAVSALVTHLDALVYARSLFDSSANYRSAMIFGYASVVPQDKKFDAMWIIGDHLMPGRRATVREITRKESAQTQVLRLPLDNFSVKVRAGGVGDALDDGEDHGVWAGLLPLSVQAGAPITGAGTDDGVPVPADVTGLAASLATAAADRQRAFEAFGKK
jgi:nitroimidazol reductase NimA-like FMN-containing flavoprotein (pyridoxamine 5'-phosphate oxidase superfamily)